jgi:uncharacterized protein YbjT (DUF2867 family)
MILVVGATGDLGGRVVQLLRDHQQDVRCLVRPATDDAGVRALGATVVRGDLVDRDSLAQACRGTDVVVASATAIGRQLAGMRHPTMREVDEDGMASLISVAETAGVGRFVYVSYAGADAGLGTPLERAKVAGEKRLRESSMTSTIVRPDAFQDIHLTPIGRFDLAQGKVAIFGTGNTRRRYVSTQDVAALLADVARDPQAPPLIEFGGPEPISRNEATDLAERLTGRVLKRQRMPRPLVRLGMRVLARPNPALASVFGAGLLQDLLPANWDDAPLRARGITPRSVTDFLTEQARL